MNQKQKKSIKQKTKKQLKKNQFTMTNNMVIPEQ